MDGSISIDVCADQHLCILVISLVLVELKDAETNFWLSQESTPGPPASTADALERLTAEVKRSKKFSFECVFFKLCYPNLMDLQYIVFVAHISI